MGTLRKIERNVLRKRVGNRKLSRVYRGIKQPMKQVEKKSRTNPLLLLLLFMGIGYFIKGIIIKN